MDLPEVPSVLHGKVLEWLAEAFVRNGDVMSHLYTNTPALLTNVMREYTSLPLAPSDTQLTVQRRYQNVLNDAERQYQYHIFLGRCVVASSMMFPPPAVLFSETLIDLHMNTTNAYIFTYCDNILISIN